MRHDGVTSPRTSCCKRCVASLAAQRGLQWLSGGGGGYGGGGGGGGGGDGCLVHNPDSQSSLTRRTQAASCNFTACRKERKKNLVLLSVPLQTPTVLALPSGCSRSSRSFFFLTQSPFISVVDVVVGVFSFVYLGGKKEKPLGVFLSTPQGCNAFLSFLGRVLALGVGAVEALASDVGAGEGEGGGKKKFRK